jgi:uncharacterized protein involved in exopolysaccharide biosynthesis
MIVHYLRILARRWWLVLLPVLPVLALALTPGSPDTQVTWIVRPTLQVGLPPARNNQTGEFYNYDSHFLWTSSEYLARSVSDLALTSKYAQNVAARIARTNGRQLPPDAIQGNIGRDFRGTLVNMTFKWHNKEEAELVGNAMMAELAENARAYFPQIGESAIAPFSRLDDGQARLDVGNVRQQLNVPLRVALALAAGAVLALLAHLLDPVIRSRREIENMGMRVLGQVPRSAVVPGARP